MNVKCRVLKPHMSHKANDIITIEEAEFKYLSRSGYVVLIGYETMDSPEIKETRKRGRPRKK